MHTLPVLRSALVAPIALLAVACGGTQSTTTETTTEPVIEAEPEIGPALVRFVHAAATAPTVDIRLDGAEVVSDLETGHWTVERMEVEPGHHTWAIFPAGADASPLLDGEADFTGETAYTIFVVGDPNSAIRIQMLDAVVTTDPMDAPDAGTSSFRFFHAVVNGQPVIVQSADGRGMAINIEYKEISDYVSAPTETTDLNLNIDGVTQGTTSVPFSEGRLYTVVAMPEGDTLRFLSINERPASAE